MKENNSSNQDKEIIIPHNVLNSSKRYMGFRGKNVKEGIVLAIILALIIMRIPFVTRIKIIFICILCISIFILSCVGIKDKCLSEIILDIKANIKLPKKWHLRSIKYENKHKKFKISENNIYTNQSLAEKIYFFIKEKIKQLRQH